MDKETNNLIKALCRQDRKAQRQLLQMYGGMVFRQITRIIPCQEDAEEVYQDVFLKVFRNIASFNEQKASLSTWINRIAYHESLNLVRKNKPPFVYVDDWKTALENIQDQELIQTFQQQNEQNIQLLERALELLSPEEQALISMFYYDNMGIKEIAYITDSIPSTIGSQLSRTRKKLYHIIKEKNKQQ